MFNLESLALVLGLKKPKKFAFLRNGVQPVAEVPKKQIVVEIPATAGNLTYTVTPDKGERWTLRNGMITLTNDATVGNRYMQGSIKSGSEFLEYTPFSAVCAASAAILWSISRFFKGHLGHASYSGGHLGWSCIIGEGLTLNIRCFGGFAGDSFEGKLVFDVEGV